MPFPSYAIATETANAGVDQALLQQELAASIAPAPDSMADDGTTLELLYMLDPTDAQKTTIDGKVNAHAAPTAIDKAKTQKVADIDSRTDELIATGFVYAGKTFSLSLAAQTKMIGSHEVKDDAALIYPLKWNTIDDGDFHSVADAADLHAFYLTAVGTVRAHLDSGTALKDQVRAAATVADVDAVEDER